MIKKGQVKDKRGLRYAVARAWLGMSHQRAERYCNELKEIWGE